MCGIAGIWNLNGQPVNARELDRFTDSMAHRGPDGRGVHVDHAAKLGLGHRRLAILDPSEAGQQPMSYADGRYWITYNGEVYNFLELRQELAASGYRFRSDTDAEVVLAAYDRWGPDCQTKFNGMWAFAIWDAEAQRLFLSRDRYGVKPLHYAYDGERFFFASELKAFLSLSSIDVPFDLSMVAFSIESPGDMEGVEATLLKNVKRLPGGCCLSLGRGQSPRVERWWRTLDHLEQPPHTLADQVDRFRELLLDAVRLRMRSDVPIGTSLSGGLDSSSLLCSIAHLQRSGAAGERATADWQRAFVATYPGTIQDEESWARRVAEEVGVTTHYCEVDFAQLVDELDDIVYHCEGVLDVPIGPWRVYQAQRRSGVVVSIDGHGSDEVLGGYHRHVMMAMADAAGALEYRRFDELRGTLRAMTGNGSAASIPSFARFLLKRYLGASIHSLRRALPARSRLCWLAIDPFRPAPWHQEEARLIRRRDALFQGTYEDVHWNGLPIELRDYDRLSMAHGVEVRCPFLDFRVVSYALSIPAKSKIESGQTKYVLREAMRGLLPEAIRTRGLKTGFSNPLSWIIGSGRPYMLDVVRSANFQQSAVWDGKALATAVERGFATGDEVALARAWYYLVAFRLMEAFDRKRAEGHRSTRLFA
jgi:asparagine synthase (glutamine-hydrolysing)